MRIVWIILGILLLLLGLACIVVVVGNVFSRADGYTSLSTMWGALAFHAVTMGLGMLCIGQSLRIKQQVT